MKFTEREIKKIVPGIIEIMDPNEIERLKKIRVANQNETMQKVIKACRAYMSDSRN